MVSLHFWLEPAIHHGQAEEESCFYLQLFQPQVKRIPSTVLMTRLVSLINCVDCRYTLSMAFNMRWQLPHPQAAVSLWSHADLLVHSYRQQRRPLRKFPISARAATSETYPTGRKKNHDASFEQTSQLISEVANLALQSGPKGFVRSLQAANAFASIGRYNDFLNA